MLGFDIEKIQLKKALKYYPKYWSQAGLRYIVNFEKIP